MTGRKDGLLIGAEGPGRAEEIAALFAAVFAASEGAEEGRLIGALARDLIATTPAADLRIFTARDAAGLLLGCILFTRMHYAGEARQVFLLSPVAVATAQQGRGIGQALIRHGLDALKAEGVDVALTYGDPAYYGRTGFRPVTEAEVAAPCPLQMPQGWLGQSLTAAPLAPLKGPVRCAQALADPGFW